MKIRQQKYKMLTTISKSKNPKKLGPLQLMKQFSKEYSKTTHFEGNQKRSKDIQHERKITNSAEKMSKFLFTNDRKTSHVFSNVISSTEKNDRPNRIRYSTLSNKRSYFKCTYTDSHPLLITDHKILPKMENKQYIQRFQLGLKIRKHSEPEELLYTKQTDSNLFKEFTKYTLGEQKGTNPVKNRQMMMKMKEKIDKAKEQKKQKLLRVRHNYLVNNCFKPHLKTDPVQLLPKPTVDSFTKTKESIFPTQFNLGHTQPSYSQV